MKQKKSVVIKWHNFSYWAYTHHLKGLAFFVYHLIQLLFGCSIPPTVVFEKGADIAHYHGIVIHKSTHIGAGTVVYQNVTIGGRNGVTGITVGKNCIIGAGAVLIGNLTIGDNVKIGANAVVLQSVPDNCTVVGVPGKIVRG